MASGRPAIRRKTKSPDKLDKFRLHLLEGKVLNSKEQLILAKYRKANALLCMGYSKNHVITVLSSEDELSESQCYAILRESIKLYGDVSDVDKKGLRAIAHENYKMLSNLARKAGDFPSAIRSLELADKVLGLYDKDDSNIDPKDFMKPMPIIFTTDVEVLKKRQRDELENDKDTFAVEI